MMSIVLIGHPNQNITDTRAPPLRLPYSPKHCVFHLSSDFRHTYTREFFPNTTCISKSEERWNTQCLGLYGSRNGGARVSVMFWGCICKDGVGTITDVEGNINSAKYIDILDNNLWPVVAKFENNQWILEYQILVTARIRSPLE
jgi:hypothetical protein